ncbi:hypothetical protein BDW69DRAFT_75768 [Aspergillus filifer]
MRRRLGVSCVVSCLSRVRQPRIGLQLASCWRGGAIGIACTKGHIVFSFGGQYIEKDPNRGAPAIDQWAESEEGTIGLMR